MAGKLPNATPPIRLLRLRHHLPLVRNCAPALRLHHLRLSPRNPLPARRCRIRPRPSNGNHNRDVFPTVNPIFAPTHFMDNMYGSPYPSRFHSLWTPVQ